MKNKLYFLGILCLFSVKVLAQITIMENKEPQKPKQIKYVYDSLRNVTKESYEDGSSFRHLIGQTLMFCGNSRGLEWSKKTFTIGDYYRVDGVLPDDPGKGLYGRLLLTNLKTNEQVQEETFKEEEYNWRWVCLGHYEKLKSLYVGKEFVYVRRYNAPSPRKVETDKANLDIKEGSLWKCVDVQVRTNSSGIRNIGDKRSPIVLVIDNPEYGKHFCYYEDERADPKFKLTTVILKGEKPLVCGVLQPKADYDKAQVLKQKKKAELTRKYGAKNAKDIMDGIIRTGMTKEMCRESWGNPDKINRTITSYGTSEQWVYGDSYVYFEGNRLSAIQD